MYFVPYLIATFTCTCLHNKCNIVNFICSYDLLFSSLKHTEIVQTELKISGFNK